jgi:hypothetical protein
LFAHRLLGRPEAGRSGCRRRRLTFCRSLKAALYVSPR